MTVTLNDLYVKSAAKLAQVDARVRTAAMALIKKAFAEGIYVQYSAGFRGAAEQQKAYNQGRTTPGQIITNARPGESYHNYGLAVDYFLLSANGKTGLWTVNAKWRRVAAIGKSLGFEWGGDWTGFRDYPHLQMTGGLTISQLQAGKRPAWFGRSANTPKASAKLSVDGVLGPATISALQRSLGTPVDGKISKPSAMVRALQRKLKVSVDGYLGPVTIKALQRKLGTPADGKISKPSPCIKALQTALNKGTF